MQNPKQIKVHSFTSKADGIVRVLISQVLVSETFNPLQNKKTPHMEKFLAIWDTGATNCVITANVVNKLKLKPIGVARVNHGGGSDDRNVYLISIILPNQVGITRIRATEGEICGEADVLIGMDIINRGDFAVTNKNGKTTYSFRMPSIEQIDFVKQRPADAINQASDIASASKSSKKTGRNEPCWCGSGKKYKYCHGKT